MKLYEVVRDGKVVGSLRRTDGYAVSRVRSGRNRHVRRFWKFALFGAASYDYVNYRTFMKAREQLRSDGYMVREKKACS